jgi:hypothetical protein
MLHRHVTSKPEDMPGVFRVDPMFIGPLLSPIAYSLKGLMDEFIDYFNEELANAESSTDLAELAAFCHLWHVCCFNTFGGVFMNELFKI